MTKADFFIESMKEQADWTYEDLVAMGRLEPFDPPPIIVPAHFLEPRYRADLLKAIWHRIGEGAPQGFVEEHEGGPLLGVPDPVNPGTKIIYEKIIGPNGAVIEAEGVVVCRL